MAHTVRGKAVIIALVEYEHFIISGSVICLFFHMEKLRPDSLVVPAQGHLGLLHSETYPGVVVPGSRAVTSRTWEEQLI